jgi:ABC-2 type transport system ATP-binding protein
MQSADNLIINIQGLSREFDKHKALDNIDLQVESGQVIGIVGENGAGKTTLIKHLLGLYRAEQGSVSVFGLDPVNNPAEVLGKIGYLSEQPDLPGWMTIAQYMNYMSAFYTGWDDSYASNLIKATSLDINKKIKSLSKGQQARVGLCAAQAHKPELLLLDEPSSGLDPLVRKEILSAAIRTVVDDGRSVVFSSHFLDEVERICDHLVMFSKGKIVLSAPMSEVLEHHKILIIGSDEFKRVGNSNIEKLPGLLRVKEKRGEYLVSLNISDDLLLSATDSLSLKIIDKRLMTLDEIFVCYCPEQQAVNGE